MSTESTNPIEMRTIRSRYRDLNAKGNGTECYRLAVDGNRTVWADQHPAAVVVGDDFPRCKVSAAWRADDRRGATKVELPVGTIVIDIDHRVSRGHKDAPSYMAGRILSREQNAEKPVIFDDAGVKHIGVRKSRAGEFVHIVEIDGERKEFVS